MNLRPFHIAFPVRDLASTRYFYETVLGCSIGRASDQWIDFNLFGHQITAHLCLDQALPPSTNLVDGRAVPVQHWGVVLEMAQWYALAERLGHEGVRFVIEPCVRFRGEVGEQATMFFLDPNGHALEFKAFRHDDAIFASNPTEYV